MLAYSPIVDPDLHLASPELVASLHYPDRLHWGVHWQVLQPSLVEQASEQDFLSQVLSVDLAGQLRLERRNLLVSSQRVFLELPQFQWPPSAFQPILFCLI